MNLPKITTRQYQLIDIFIITLGCLLRIHEYLSNRSLWLDEALLSQNITQRNYISLLEPLDARQNAPIGFLWFSKLSTQILGNYEYALRFPALVFGLLSLLVFVLILHRYFDKPVATLSLAFFAFSDPLIFYSAEVKQYSGELMACLLILGLTLYVVDKGVRLISSIIFGIIGGLLFTISSSVVFFMASVALYLTIYFFKSKDWQNLKWSMVMYCPWGLLFILNYWLLLSKSVEQSGLQRSWEARSFFPPIPFLSPIYQTVRWYIDTFYNVFESPGGFITSGLAAFLFIIGCGCLYRRQKHTLFLFLLPIIFTFTASVLRKYPFTTMTDSIHGGRLLLHLTPILFILIAEGAYYFIKEANPKVVVVLLIILMANPMLNSVNRLSSPRTLEEIKPVIEYVMKNRESSDAIYVSYRTRHQFRYYRTLLSLEQPQYVIEGLPIREETMDDFFSSIRDHDRVWLIFSYTLEQSRMDKDRALMYLNALASPLDEIKEDGASAYLYEIQ